ncbi:hypothetical protein DI005_34965 [Prauserella sp. PE36]|uniref:Small CPxCG-related zinc finger protein n=1 Tax=Prauserella endophytica TaxID=1592324 RepID=A0ABY2RTD9_9PSEU|nr:hypothetical protein DI005_34965 [Prauserella sp. PE36]TKG59887.1 hypothetical protein FCN18_36280 [Prauserella endophytica]
MTEPTAVCSVCGVHRDSAGPVDAMAWVRETEDGRTRWLCPRCARDHLRDIEGKLPAGYW